MRAIRPIYLALNVVGRGSLLSRDVNEAGDVAHSKDFARP